eukprot:151686-Amphidinium_carterae.1
MLVVVVLNRNARELEKACDTVRLDACLLLVFGRVVQQPPCMTTPPNGELLRTTENVTCKLLRSFGAVAVAQ